MALTPYPMWGCGASQGGRGMLLDQHQHGSALVKALGRSLAPLFQGGRMQDQAKLATW